MSVRLAAAAGLLGAAAAAAVGQPPPLLAKWSFDEVRLTNGSRMSGLILSETPADLTFQSVVRMPGRATVTLTTTLPRKQVASVTRLGDADRAVLKERLAELDPTGEGERNRMDSLDLAAADWLGRPGGGRRYQSEYFTLVSGSSEEVTRRAAVRLEQIYAAFAQVLPPTAPDARPTRIELAPQGDEFRALLGSIGAGGLQNPAVFDPATNRVVCGSELRPLGEELKAARLHHAQQLASIDRYEAEVRRLYKGSKAELDRHLEASGRERRTVWAADRKALARFDAATTRLFAILYHEAFHAYVSAFVYRPLPPADVAAGKGTGELPRWLNEGLAQVFETARVEAGELRADHPDRDRLVRVQDGLRGKGSGRLVPLADLLTAGRGSFLAAHADQRAAADRAYLSAWALAYYLTFDRRVIGTDAFRKYLVAANSGGDPRAAFEELVGQPPAAFEADWHAYLAKLQVDGSVSK